MTSLGTDRRTLLRGSVALTAFLPASVLVDARPSAAATPLRWDPFTIGVASGDPAPDGFVIWTRLAPDPLAEDGLGLHPRAVRPRGRGPRHAADGVRPAAGGAPAGPVG